MNRYIMPVILAVAALSWAALIFIPPDYSTSKELDSFLYDRISGVSVLKPPLNRVIWYAGLACVPLLLLASAEFFRRAHKPALFYCVVTLLLAVVAFPYALLRRVRDSLAPWVVCDTVTGPNGDSYVFLDSSFMQGQMLALGRILPDSLFHNRFEILGGTNGDNPKSYLLLVRPTNNIKAGYGRLYLANDKVLLGVRYDNKCYFAYDFRQKKFFGHDDIEALSPFLLVDDDDSLFRADIDSFLANEFWPAADPVGSLPCEPAIRLALDHPNLRVRDAAQRMISKFALD